MDRIPLDLKALDFETTGTLPYAGDRPFSVATCDVEGSTWFARAEVDPFTRKVTWNNLLREWAKENPRTPLCFHNCLFDIRMAATEGVDLWKGREIHDTMCMVHVIYSLEPTGLKYLGEKWLEVPKDDEEELITNVKKNRKEAAKKGWKIADDSGRWGDKPYKADYWLADPELLQRYNQTDSERTMLLFGLLWPELEKEPRLMEKYKREMQILKATYEMSGYGVQVDRKVIDFEIKRNNFKIGHYRKKVIQSVGFDLNLNSPKQVGDYIYDVLKYPVRHYTEKGNASTNGEALLEIDHPIVKDIVKLKAAEKANSTFFEKYKFLSSWENGMWILHPEFDPLRARTWRFACRNPNLQNVANALNTRSLEPIQARTPFIPRPGKVWYHLDWSQIEMWIFAAEANDVNMLADLGRTEGIHTATANRVYGKGRDIVAEEMKSGRSNARARAKMLNFGIIFGMGLQATMDFLKCTKAEAKYNLELYYTAYPRIRPFMQEISSQAAVDGFIWNRFGTRLQVDRHASYKATNYRVQGSAADFMKIKMLWLCKYLQQNPSFDGKMILTIHDEVVVEAPYDPISIAHIKVIKKEFEDIHGMWPNLRNLPADVSITKTDWSHKEKSGI